MVLFCAGLALLAVATFPSEPFFTLAGCFFAGLLSIASLKLYPLDPRVWFSTLGALYCFAHSLLVVLGAESEPSDVKATAISGIFFLSVLTAMWSGAVISGCLRRVAENNMLDRSAIKIVVAPLVMVVAAYVVLDSSLIALAGAKSKRELWDLNAGLPFSGFASNLLMLCSGSFLLSTRTKAAGIRVSLFVGFVVTYMWMATGEREGVFIWGLIAAFAWVLRGWVRVRSVALAGLLFLAAAPIMKDFGLVAAGGDVEFKRTRELHISFLQGEWAATGSNLEIILRGPELYEKLGMERLSEDIARGVLPGMLASGENTSNWYANYYTPHVINRNVPGLGFTLTGSLWIYGGIVSVVLGGLIYGFFSWFFFSFTRRRLLFLSAYLLYIPLSLWSLRGDVSYWLSSILKQTALPTIILIILSSLVVGIARNIRRRRLRRIQSS